MTPTSLALDGRQLEYQILEGGDASAPHIVFLHEGLGSLALWKDFPRRVVERTGCSALVYSRFGYGRSAQLTGSRPVQFMHDEALAVLPRVLAQLGVQRPILFGHSDGASIALIHAGAFPDGVAGVIVMAPHLFVEPMCTERIAAARVTYETTALPQQLARYHDDVEGAFRGWNDVWLSPAFRAWNIEDHVARITAPLLAIQGNQDEYGSMEQLARIQRLLPSARLLALDDCRHSPHRDQPEAVLDAVHGFVQRLTRR